MRKPEQVEALYIDFDGFFAGVEQQARPALRGHPVGILPFQGTRHTICIAVSKEAKALGIKTGTSVTEALEICPEIKFQRQTPELYVRAHHALLAAIEMCTPIAGACSIDELACDISPMWRSHPEDLGRLIKQTLREEVGPYITGSIGIAANRHLAKIVCKWDKPDGLTVLRPEDMPGGLLDMEFEDVPGVGSRMERRLALAGITDMRGLWYSQPKHLRQIWGSVAGERFWYLLHGYDVPGDLTKRRMFGHGRVLPPTHRSLARAEEYSTFLLTKAARRMRSEDFRAGSISLWLSGRNAYWSREYSLPLVKDDQACLKGLDALWQQVRSHWSHREPVIRVGVFLSDLWTGERQLNFLVDDERERQRWEAITEAIDEINTKYDRTLISVGPLRPPPGQYAGAKIAYTRIPDFRDFEKADFH